MKKYKKLNKWQDDLKKRKIMILHLSLLIIKKLNFLNFLLKVNYLIF